MGILKGMVIIFKIRNTAFWQIVAKNDVRKKLQIWYVIIWCEQPIVKLRYE